MSKRARCVLGLLLLFLCAGVRGSASPEFSPEYINDAQLRLPQHYREWVFLSSGFDMSYTALPKARHTFTNVFVNPEAYSAFQKTGRWPDKTMFVLESRSAESSGSINQSGNYQTTSITGLEVHVKDEARFPHKWAFFSFGSGATAKMIPQSADCYSCHEQHGAVDTTFVQFYPTLLPIAQSKGTVTNDAPKASKP